MVREDIVGGLRNALAKGDSLEKAMMSFYNSGYKKEDIEDAARFVQSNPIAMPQNSQPQIPQQQTQPKILTPLVPSTKNSVPPQSSQPQVPQTPQVPQIPQQIQQPDNSQVVQRVSNYTPKPKRRIFSTLIIVILTLLLLGLIGVLVAMLVFKQQTTDFLSKLFGTFFLNLI